MDLLSDLELDDSEEILHLIYGTDSKNDILLQLKNMTTNKSLDSMQYKGMCPNLDDDEIKNDSTTYRDFLNELLEDNSSENKHFKKTCDISDKEHNMLKNINNDDNINKQFLDKYIKKIEESYKLFRLFIYDPENKNINEDQHSIINLINDVSLQLSYYILFHILKN